MYVCLCKAVTDRELDDAIEQGADTVGALATELGVGTGCGCCQEFVRERLETVTGISDDGLFYAA